jgi:hypothetical protein
MYMAFLDRSYLKNASNTQKLGCKPPLYAHPDLSGKRFFVSLRLALERNLLFLRPLLLRGPDSAVSRPLGPASSGEKFHKIVGLKGNFKGQQKSFGVFAG